MGRQAEDCHMKPLYLPATPPSVSAQCRQQLMPDTWYSHPMFWKKMMAIYGYFETQGLKFWSQRINGTNVALFMTLISNGKHISQDGKKQGTG